MPCQVPFRSDSSQLLLWKIASCLEASGGGGGSVTAAQIIAALGCTPACEGDVVNSFNTRVGDVVLTLADVSTVADGRYVLKAGDTMTGALVHPDGTAALPSITFTGDLDTGIYHPAANTVGVSVNGVLALTVNSTSAISVGTVLIPDGTAALPALAFAADTNTGIYRIGADILGFSTAGTARWQISAAGHLLATTDNIYDIGASGATRLRSIYVGTSLIGPNSSGINSSGGLAGTSLTLGNNAFLNGGTGIITLTDTGVTFNRLQFGGTTSAFPSIKRSAATLQFRLADDSAFAGIATAAIVMSTAAPLSITSGANQRAGDVVLVAGTVTTANTTVTANTRVYTSRKTAGGVLGNLTYTLIAATSFTITSDNVADTSTVSYLLIEVP